MTQGTTGNHKRTCIIRSSVQDHLRFCESSQPLLCGIPFPLDSVDQQMPQQVAFPSQSREQTIPSNLSLPFSSLHSSRDRVSVESY